MLHTKGQLRLTFFRVGSCNLLLQVLQRSGRRLKAQQALVDLGLAAGGQPEEAGAMSAQMTAVFSDSTGRRSSPDAAPGDAQRRIPGA